MTTNDTPRKRELALAHKIWSLYEYDTPDAAAALIEKALREARNKGWDNAVEWCQGIQTGTIIEFGTKKEGA